MNDKNIIKLSEVVGGGYADVWNSRCRYVIIKGSRASKKSTTVAIWHVYHMMKMPLANTLCVRKTLSTLHDSCFAVLRWAIHRLGVDHLWKVRENPMELTYLPSGNKILFRGLDDPLKLTSVTVDKGVLNFVWFEEFYEVFSEEEFATVDESIRGELPEGYFKRITATMNPWSSMSWIKARFFDTVDPTVLAVTKNYTLNEFLAPEDLALFERMKVQNPKRYQVAGLGEWGQIDGVIYDNYEVQDLTDIIPTFANIYYGLDFGCQDPNALVSVCVEMGQKKIYVFDEYYQGNITLNTLCEEVSKRVGNNFVTCDSAGSQNILELNNHGIWAIGAKKGPDSIKHGIMWLQDFDIIIHEDCKNFIKEISEYSWDKDKFGNTVDRPVDKDNHLMDALRYAVEPIMLNNNSLESTKRLF